MPSGHTISISIHPGPQNAITETGFWKLSSLMSHDYSIAITFTPPNLLFRSPVDPRTVYPRPAAPLPQLTIYVDVLFDWLLLASNEQRSSTWVQDRDGAMPQVVWTPTEQDETAALGIFIQEKLVYPLFKFEVVDSAIVLELAKDPPGLGQESGYGRLLGVMRSYVNETNPADLGTRKRYRFPADFPAEVEMDGRAMRIEFTNQRVSLNDVASYQMLLRTHPMPPQQNPSPAKFVTAVNWSETKYSIAGSS
ncbi:hypothetical protein GALMADRAFT_259696 [Galerina marginata CBS 339.88]|uniref:Uncharacterized protein n=1 Tax=Galerina marginata (strain CBS 339.88) TaxID=685588 RepID=A0A067S5W7_GALM3|nr:hypothetical protein GALMADRAFT_259696 [Galerina marginata CBS 339.88]